MTENAEELSLELPLLSCSDFKSLIEDTLVGENYSFEENEDPKLKIRLVRELIATCLIAQKIVRHGNTETIILSKIQKKFKIELFKGIEPKKTELNRRPYLLQLPFLISNFELTPHQIGWAKIAFYLAIVIKHHNKQHKLKSYYQRIIKRFKIACFYKTTVKIWILENLPSFLDKQNGNLTTHQLMTFLKKLEERTVNTTYRNQAKEIKLCIEVILNPKRRKKIDQEIKTLDRKRKKRKKKLSKELSLQDFVQTILNINNDFNTFDDCENIHSNLQAIYLGNEDVEEDKPTSNEVKVDNINAPCIQYETKPPISVRHSAPLQIVDLSAQQMYISQRELVLNSSVYLLSPKAYQLVFARIVKDCQLQDDKLKSERLKIKTLATVLLLSMITSIPVESLITRGFVKNSGLFNLLKTKAYLQSDFDITARKKKFDAQVFENKKASIELPIPRKLVDFLANKRLLPEPTNIRDYIAQIREELSLPYLSVHRIESTLQVILTRYVQGSNNHIADIICRIPPMSAPAKFYSSHTLDELINHYKNALIWLRQDTLFDLSFLETKKEYTTGSGQALTLPFVKSLLEDIFNKAVISSASKFELFNHISSYVWLIFCLLTGIRPNNRITHIHDIDLNEDFAQILISDKPNRSVRNPRIVPICSTLLKTLTLYRIFLSRFTQYLHRKTWIHHAIHPILHEHENSDSMLINLIFEQGEKIATVKRGQIEQFIKPFFEIDPYFTRHFVRVQLEKRGAQMPIINAVMGHEKHRQEFFGQYSSGSKSDIYAVADIFEAIACDLGFSNIEEQFQQIDKLVRQLPEQISVEQAG